MSTRIGHIISPLSIGLVGLAMLLPSASAAASEADQPARILVIKTQRLEGVSSIVASRLHGYLETVLGLSSAARFISSKQLDEADAVTSGPTIDVVEDGTLVRANAALDKAKGLVGKKEYLAATKAFKRALSLYQKRLAVLEDFDKVVDAQLGRALAFFLAGYDDNGEDELAKVLAMRPALALDKRRTPDAMTKALARLQALFAKSQAGALTVEADVAGAQVYVDGRRVGTTPVTLTDLSRGGHAVRIVAKGHEPWAKMTTVRSSAVTENARLKARKAATGSLSAISPATEAQLIEAAQTGLWGSALVAQTKALCAKYGVSGVVLSAIGRPGTDDGPYHVVGFYFDAQSGRIAATPTAQIDADLATMQLAVVDVSDVLVKAVATFPGDLQVEGRHPIYSLRPAAVASAPPLQPAAPSARPTAVKPDPPVVAARPEPVMPAPRRTVLGGDEPGPHAPTGNEAPAANSVVVLEPDPLDTPSALALAGTRDAADAEARRTAEPLLDEPEFYETWWFWTLIGGVVAGGATATYFAVDGAGGGDDPGFRTAVQF